MEPQEFLAAVLPPPGHGYYCSATLPSRRHKFSRDLTEVTEQAFEWAQERQDAYFALSTFKTLDVPKNPETGKKEIRTGVNASYIKSLFIDMDNYASKKEAASALSAFLERTGLDTFGTPWVVASGGGLHCYWALEEAVEIAQWKPVGEALKRLCKQEALVIDWSVPADAARLLRVPGTWNFKPKYPEPRPVRLLVEGCTVSFDAFSQHIFSLVGEPEPAMPTLALPGQRPTPTATGVKLLENSLSSFKTILLRTRDGTGCAQLAHYVEHAADEGMEPLWRGWLSQAKFCADGDRAAKWLSDLHPYEPQRMQTKLREIKGPYPCLKFDSENPGICQKCPHFGKITNPLALGRELVADNAPKEIELTPNDPDDPEAPPVKVTRPTPPKGYSYGVNGGVYVDKMVEEADGTKRKRQVLVLPYDLFVVDLLSKEGEHTVHMVANRPGRVLDILMQQRYAVSKDECIKTLAQQNIIAAFGPGNDVNLYEYVRACVVEASTNKQPVIIPAQYGWQEDGSFVYSGRVFRPDGTWRTVPMPDLANITRNTRASGTLEGWRKLPQMLIRRKLYDHLAIACIAFGSPLMRFTQMSALTFHAGSTDSGTGKSLALSLLNSVWGHPIRYRTGKSTSPVTMQQRMGNLNSLPFTSDEITHKSRQDMEWFPGFIFDASEGQGKEKSEVHHNRERINNVAWSMLLLLTSNTHMHDYMSGARNHTSQGELLRMLEWTPEMKLEWAPDEEDLLKSMSSHYGVAGERFVKWLVQNQETARRVTLEVIAQIKREWEMSGDERFWAAGCGCVIAGAILASKKYADVIDLPVDGIMQSLHNMVVKARKIVKSGTRTAEDILNAYTREHFGSFVVLRVSNGSLLSALGNGQEIDQTITRGKVLGRVEHEVTKKGYVEYFIDEQMLKAHCVSMSYGYDAFKRNIQAIRGYVVEFNRKDLMAKTKGPQMRVRAISISRPIEDDPNAEVLSVGPR